MRAWLLILLASCAVAAQPAADRLRRTLDGMDVAHLWLSGHERVDWRTGQPLGPASSSRRHTHCSQFAAAVADRLGIYLLRPPEHSSVLLANAQEQWLQSPAGQKAGWTAVPDGWEARQRANQGQLVVAVYRNPDPHKSGHIAVIRPSDWDRQRVERDGPEIIQAGGHNYASASLRQGFGNHPEAFRDHKIEFFAHSL